MSTKAPAELLRADDTPDYRALVERAEGAMFATDGAGICHYVNDACKVLSPPGSPDLVGQPWQSIIYPPDRPRVEATWQHAMENNAAFDTEFRIGTDPSVLREVAVRLSPVFAHSRLVTGYVGYCSDITASRVDAATLRRYQFIANAIPDMISVIDRAHCYEAVNDRWCAMMKRPRESVIGKPMIEIWGEEVYTRTIRPALEHCFTSATPLRSENEIPYEEAGALHCEIRYLPYPTDAVEPEHVIIVIRDMSEAWAAEHALKDALERAESASRAKSEFLSRVSHELRTPLNAILGFSQLLIAAEDLTAEQSEGVEEILGAGRHLLNLIEDVLDLSRIESNQLEIHVCEVGVDRIVDECVALVEADATERGVRILHDSETLSASTVVADPIRLKQVVLNLVSNAVKYGRRDGKVVIDVRVEASAYLRVTVGDDGPGIPYEKQDALFTAFDRLGQQHTGTQGTGIGLVIAKQLVELMGGRIGFDSVPGHGTTFWIDLPGQLRAES